MPDLSLEKEERDKLLYEALETLTPREIKILDMRFGLNGHMHTLDETGKICGVTRERIRQIEAKALRKMRNQIRIKVLKEYT